MQYSQYLQQKHPEDADYSKKKIAKKTLPSQFEKGDSTEDKPARRFFENNPEDVSDGEENIIKMPVTNTKDLNTLIHVVCEKRGVDPDNIKLMLGVDGGQGKLLCTLAIVPNNEKDKMGRMSQTNVKDRSKSTSVKRCLVVGRVDSIPENYSNITVLMSKMNLPALRNDFCVVADLKLVDIMAGSL